VIVAVTEERPRILSVPGPDGMAGLPSGALQAADRTLELALRRFVADQAALQVGYVEQLYTFGDLDRAPGALRPLSIAYLALVRESRVAAAASWIDWYELFPWEDYRSGSPTVLAEVIEPALLGWIAAAAGVERQRRQVRAQVCFGLDGTPWDGVRVLERYELLYEVGLLAESPEERRRSAPNPVGRSMRSDHRRIVATSLGRLRGKLTYRPVVFELLPDRFTLLQLQRVVEALSGVRLHKQNFRRLIEAGGLVEGTGALAPTGGRPAELFRFRSDVVRERPRPGVGTPWTRA
jgi:hypothetical protein